MPECDADHLRTCRVDSLNPCGIAFRSSAGRADLETQAVMADIAAGRRIRVKAIGRLRATLAPDGTADGLPFMPEMTRYCGYSGFARPADRICLNGFRRLDHVFHLDNLRCDGKAHDECDARCLLFWHVSWLEAVDSKCPQQKDSEQQSLPAASPAISDFSRAEPRYFCQATAASQLGTPLPLPGPFRLLFEFLHKRIGISDLGRLCVWAFDYVLLHLFVKLAGNRRSVLKGDSNVQAGELVRVKSKLKILRTLGPEGRHYGLTVVPDMLRYCGGTYRVAGRVHRIVEPLTGEMREMKNECIVLEGVTCSGGRSFCSRCEFFFWREAWLERV